MPDPSYRWAPELKDRHLSRPGSDRVNERASAMMRTVLLEAPSSPTQRFCWLHHNQSSLIPRSLLLSPQNIEEVTALTLVADQIRAEFLAEPLVVSMVRRFTENIRTLAFQDGGSREGAVRWLADNRPAGIPRPDEPGINEWRSRLRAWGIVEKELALSGISNVTEHFPPPPVFQFDFQPSRAQLVDIDYDPISQGDIDAADLKTRYPHHDDLQHAAATRGILVRDDASKQWRWIWGIGLLHYEMLELSEYPRLYGRFRNQFSMLPRIELEPGSDTQAALRLLLDTTAILSDDSMNIEAPSHRATSIAHFFGDRQ